MNMSLREENVAPLVMTRSLMMCGSEMATKSWFPITKENNGPYFLAHLSRMSSGYFAR